MICKGTTHNNGANLAAYMTTSKKGERAELWELRGFEATNIKDAFRDVQIMAGATRCEQPFFHVQVRNREGETLTRQQWEYAADRVERMLGLTGQPRAIAFHTYDHNGDQHMHVAWSRIDEETMTARPLPFFKERLKKVSREMELHFALEPVTNHREGNIKYAPTRAEHEQARRLGLDIHEVRNTIRTCYERSDCGASLQKALEREGLTLAQGERRDFVVVDQAGGLHALGKRILDVSAAKLRDRLSDLSREELPSVETARASIREPEKQKPQQEERAVPAWDRDHADREWQGAVVNAAIKKDKTKRRFVEASETKTTRDAGKAAMKDRAATAANDGIESPVVLGKIAVHGFGKTLDVVGNALESLFAPVIASERRDEGNKATCREIEAEAEIDFSKYTAHTAQQRFQQENDREAERRRHRDGGGPER